MAMGQICGKLDEFAEGGLEVFEVVAENVTDEGVGEFGALGWVAFEHAPEREILIVKSVDDFPHIFDSSAEIFAIFLEVLALGMALIERGIDGIGGIELLEIAVDLGVDLRQRGMQLRRAEVAPLAVDRPKLAAVDGHQFAAK